MSRPYYLDMTSRLAIMDGYSQWGGDGFLARIERDLVSKRQVWVTAGMTVIPSGHRDGFSPTESLETVIQLTVLNRHLD